MSAAKITIRVYKDRAGEWRWDARTANGQIVADSGEGYKRHQSAESQARKLWPAAEIIHEGDAAAGETKVERISEVRTEDGGRLGRHVEHDPRSRDFPFMAAAKPLKKVEWKRDGDVFDQGELGSCTGNALVGLLNTAPFRVSTDPLFTEGDAVAIYTEATHLDRFRGFYPPDDTGSSGLAVCKAAKARGLISSYHHAFSVASALAALQTGPVITGVEWYDGFDHPDAKGVVGISGAVRGGHEFEVVSYDPVTKLVGAINSWGPGWGKNGRFYFTSMTWKQLLDRSGDVTIPSPPLPGQL